MQMIMDSVMEKDSVCKASSSGVGRRQGQDVVSDLDMGLMLSGTQGPGENLRPRLVVYMK